MRELTHTETKTVTGGNPLAGGFIGAGAGALNEYSKGGDAGDIIMGATTGFATGFFGGVAWAARSVYYGVVTAGAAVMGGAPDWREQSSS